MVKEGFSCGVGVVDGDHEAGMADMALFFDRTEGVLGILLF